MNVLNHWQDPLAKIGAWRLRSAVRRDPVSIGFHAALPWLLVSLCITVSALIGNVPLPSLLLIVACAAWRQWVEHTGRRMPSRLLRLAVFLPALGILLFTYSPQSKALSLLTFLVALLSLKVLELRNHRDFIVVAVLCYFMNLSAFFYSQSLALSLYLGVAALTNTIALIRCHDGGRKHPLIGSVRLAVALMLQAIPVVVLLFVVFPRLQLDQLTLSHFTKGVTGMSEHLQPGTFESLAQSTETAFRAKIIKGGNQAARNLYWRGLVLGICEAPLSWRAGDPPSSGDAPSFDRDALAPSAGLIEQVISLRAQGERWLYALDRPVGVKYSPPIRAQLLYGNVLRSHSPVENNSIYTAYSETNLKYSGELPALERNFYRDTPLGISPRVKALVQEWTRPAQALTGAAREMEIIRRARLFFRDGGFAYTLSPGVLPEDHPLDYFLFKSRKGFCEHFAAAFSTLMRVAGLPSRIVVGYQGGEYNTWGGGYYLIRQSDAHAWSEVWIDGQGWQREDPTAVVAPDRVSFGAEDYAAMNAGGLNGESRLDRLAGINSPGLWRWLVHSTALAWDGLDQQWNSTVLGYDQEKRENTLQDLGLGNLNWLEGGALALAAAFSLLALGAFAVRTFERRQVKEVDPAARLYERFCRRVARWAGVQRAVSEGPLDFSHRAVDSLPEQARQIHAITDLYVRSRYASPVHDDLTARTLEALSEAVDSFHEPAHKPD